MDVDLEEEKKDQYVSDTHSENHDDSNEQEKPYKLEIMQS